MSVRTAALWAASSQYYGFVLQFISSVIIARYFLDPEEFGLFAVAFSAAGLIHGLQDFGLNRHVVGAEHMGRKQIRLSVSVSVVVALAITAIIMAMAWPVSVFYGNEKLLPILMVIGCSYIFIPFTVTSVALLQREMNFKRCAIIDVGSNTINVGIVIISAWQGYSSLSLAFGVFGYQLSRAILAQCLRPIFHIWPLSYKGSIAMFRYGLSSSLVSLTGAASASGPDLIIGKVASEAAVGLYGRATGLALQFRLLVGGPIAAVFYPSLARARDKGEHLGGQYLQLTAALCAVTWGAMAGLAVASEPLILAVYGEKWLDSAALLFWIALSQIFYIAIPMQIEVAYLTGGWRKIIIITIVDTILSLSLLAYAAQYGILWAAMSRIVHGMIWLTVHAIFIQGLVKFSWSELFSIYWKTAAAAAAATVPLLLAYYFWIPAREMSFILLTLLSLTGVILWAITLHLTRHPSAEDLFDMALGPIRKITTKLAKT